MGKQIRIYLADESASGIRHAEVSNWTGQALACPRARFQELREWAEVRRPGVYLLFGTVEDTEEEAVYVGESEVVLDRLTAHISGKEFWTELIAFTSKDDNLTKGHVKYLEARLIDLATKADRYRVTNGTVPQLPALPRGDRDAMEEFLGSARTLLGVLGHKVLDPFVSPNRPREIEAEARDSPDLSVGSPTTSIGLKVPERDTLFLLRTGNVVATAARTDEGMVVLAGSYAAPSVQGSLSTGYRTLREKLISLGVISPAGDKLCFVKDQLFSSPSQAAAIIVGYAINGRDAWRLEDGTTYAEFEQLASQSLAQDGAPWSKEQIEQS
jgi:hypothetical protein